jgi:uncharacterized protein YycO
MYIGNGMIIESVADGVKINSIDKYLSGDYNVCKITLKDKSRIDEVVNCLLSKIGMKYGYLQNVLTFFLIILNKITGKDYRKYIELNEINYSCSELIASSIKEVYNYKYNASNFFPSDFLKYPEYFNYEKKITVKF